MPRKPRAHPKPQRRVTFIRAWRKHRGLTQAQVLDQLLTLHGMGLSDAQLSRIETGKQPYAQDLLEALADVLQTGPDSLIMRDPSRTEFWTIYDTLTPAERKQVTDYAAFIRRKTA
jgi:transcriptional regulator with XRE-family HTH domain